MKRELKSQLMRTLSAVLALAGALAVAPAALGAASPAPDVVPAGSAAFGKTYAEWNAANWTWFMGLPLTNSAGVTHPSIAAPTFDVTEGQSGTVWFLAAPFGTTTRHITIPAGTALFIGAVDVESSDLEGLGATYNDRLANARSTADAISVSSLSFSVDGARVSNPGAYRVVSPQFTFTAPTPWVFGSTGGTGTSIGDGYYFLVNPLPVGKHTIRFGGSFPSFGLSLDMTYKITVE